MNDLIDHMGAGLCRTGLGADRGQAAVQRAVDRIGTIAGAARALQIPRSTLRGWLAGRTPKRTPRAVTAAARGVLSASRYDDAYAGITKMVIVGLVRVSRDVRTRRLNVGQHIPQPIMKRVLTAWAGADDKRAETLLRNAISKYYTDLDIDTVESVWFL